MYLYLKLLRKLLYKTFSSLFVLLIMISNADVVAAEIVRVPIGTTSTPTDSEVQLKLIHRFQHYRSKTGDQNDIFDTHINSPKSVIFLTNNHKFYINSLEGYETIVYDAQNFKTLNIIKHKFTKDNSALFQDESTIFDYKYAYRNSDYNIFSGKPVESCLTHNDKYLWVSYYRRSFDQNAVSPSAVAIINTENDSIVRVMPTGPLPKMVAASPDNRYLAVTHWGDNTIGIIDIQGNDVSQFKYIKHFVVGKKMKFSFAENEKVDRDNDCGYCLRGTVFTPDSLYLLVGRMGGGGIAFFDMQEMKYLGTVFGMADNLRHIIISGDQVIISSNRTGIVQRAALKEILENKMQNPEGDTYFNNWKSCYSGGTGARTICATSDGKYVFTAVNNASKIALIRTDVMKIIADISCDSYPVGMAISPNDARLVVTSQGKNNEGGHSVMVFQIDYRTK